MKTLKKLTTKLNSVRMYAKKSLGQHFLRCRWVAQTLIKTAGVDSKDTVLEVGPGTGILTRELAKSAKKVIAVEKDKRLAEELKQTLKREGVANVAVVAGDILKKLDLNSIWVKYLTHPQLGSEERYKVVANIPYYLTSKLLRLLLENEPRPEIIVLTVQKEVAERVCAKPPSMNLLALSVQAYGRPEIIKKVPASCFWPKPKVDSAIIKIKTKPPFWGQTYTYPLFFKIIRLAFSQKRKTLAHSLGRSFGKKEIEKALEKTNLPLTSRPEEISLENWIVLISRLITKNRA